MAASAKRMTRYLAGMGDLGTKKCKPVYGFHHGRVGGEVTRDDSLAMSEFGVGGGTVEV